jgi:hypothetical protein
LILAVILTILAGNNTTLQVVAIAVVGATAGATVVALRATKAKPPS